MIPKSDKNITKMFLNTVQKIQNQSQQEIKRITYHDQVGHSLQYKVV